MLVIVAFCRGVSGNFNPFRLWACLFKHREHTPSLCSREKAVTFFPYWLPGLLLIRRRYWKKITSPGISGQVRQPTLVSPWLSWEPKAWWDSISTLGWQRLSTVNHWLVLPEQYCLGPASMKFYVLLTLEADAFQLSEVREPKWCQYINITVMSLTLLQITTNVYVPRKWQEPYI